MSSSKIQERNLDSNMGLAKESTLEIMSDTMAKELSLESLAETVNTMKTTLDTLISNNNDGGGFVDMTKLKIHRLTSNANVLCNLTGKKRIHHVIIYHANSSDRTLTIQIDGKTSYAVAPRDVYNGVLVWSRVVHNDNFFDVVKNVAESSSIPSAVIPATFDVQNSLKISFDGSNEGLCKIIYEDLS